MTFPVQHYKTGIWNFNAVGSGMTFPSCFHSVHSSIMKKDMKFFETEVIPLRQMLHCATACMAMPEVASVKHAASFISNFIIVSRESQCLVSIANDMGEGIFRQVK